MLEGAVSKASEADEDTSVSSKESHNKQLDLSHQPLTLSTESLSRHLSVCFSFQLSVSFTETNPVSRRLQSTSLTAEDSAVNIDVKYL